MSTKRYSFKRSDRVGELLHREISQVLQTEVKDPGLGFVTVTGVRSTEDLREATVFVSVMGRDKQKSMESLSRAAKHIRACVARRCYLKFVPQLHFKLDSSLEEVGRIDRILRHLRADNPPGENRDQAQGAESQDLGNQEN